MLGGESYVKYFLVLVRGNVGRVRNLGVVWAQLSEIITLALSVPLVSLPLVIYPGFKILIE